MKVNNVCSKCGWKIEIKTKRVGKFTRFWLKVNDNKTVICTGLAGAAKFAGIWLGPGVGVGLFWLFVSLGGGSLIHKGNKKKNSMKIEKDGEGVTLKDWFDLILEVLRSVGLLKTEDSNNE